VHYLILFRRSRVGAQQPGISFVFWSVGRFIFQNLILILIAIATMFGTVTLAVGSSLAVLAVGLITSGLLEFADTYYKIINRIIAGLNELGKDTRAYIEQRKQDVQNSLSKAP